MKKGDLVVLDTFPDFLVEEGAERLRDDRNEPGIVIRGPYGAVSVIRSRIDGKAKESIETRVADVLFGRRVITRIPVENLKVIV